MSDKNEKRRGRGFIRLAGLAALSAMAALPLGAHGGGGWNYDKPAGIDLSARAYRDGSYVGTAEGFRPGLEVEVTVKDGKVAIVKVIDHNEVDRRFYALPIQVIPSAIVKKQKTKVDAVSGATATSNAIMAAVERALENALVKAE